MTSPLVGQPETAEAEIATGRRFAFGRNWSSFLRTLNEQRIALAVHSLQELLGQEDLNGQSFLDVGSGSGLFSLAARKLGARVHSFDFDSNSVACAKQLRDRFSPADSEWTIDQGSALDRAYLESLGTFDVVYSWGVLHHTGQMWPALENVTSRVSPQGLLAIALYNDQGWLSRLWLRVKRLYCAHLATRWMVLLVFIPYFFVRTVLVSVIRRHNEFARYRRNRGMSIVHDWLDWLGGLPFEVATVTDVQKFCEERGFDVVRINRTNRLGNNEFVFRRVATPVA